MLPRLVGGPELLLNKLVGPLEFPHDQLLRWSAGLPFENGGVAGREVPSLRPEEAVIRE